jgi:ribosomal protein S18 acetylase RimI-like enzyme
MRKPADGAAGLRGQLGAADDDILVLSLARLAWDKGLEYLIRAAAILPYTERRVHVAIAGDGPMRESLEKLAIKLGVTGRVTFLGFRSDVSSLLAACDVVAVPSLREGLSIALLEAMAAGKAIVASSIGSQREVASQGDVARLVPPGDAHALCAAITQFARKPELAAHLGRAARELFESRYTEERMLSAYRRLYFDLLVEKCPAHVRRRPERAHQSNRAGAAVVRAAEEQDLPEVVSIHRKAFSHFFLTQLGSDFLDRYYGLVFQFPEGILLVSEANGVVNGFVSGFVDPAGFYRFMWNNRWGFVRPVLAAVLRHPSLVTKVIQGVQRIQTTSSEWPSGSCELSSIAVSPESSGGGVGKALMRAFLDEAGARNARAVYLTTDAEDNQQANELYRRVGFQQVRRFLQRKGRWMNEYVIDGLATEGNCEART